MRGLDAFRADLEAEQKGIWSRVGDMEFLIARIGNDSWKREYKRMEDLQYGPARRRSKKLVRDEEYDVDMMLECLAKTCILDWKNVSLNGKEIKFSVDKCVEILKDPKYKKLAAHLLDLAGEEDRYLAQEVEEDIESAKN